MIISKDVAEWTCMHAYCYSVKPQAKQTNVILNSDRLIISTEDGTVKSLSLWPGDIECITSTVIFSICFPNINTARLIVSINNLYDASALSQMFAVRNA
jgi:hypothetical protein